MSDGINTDKVIVNAGSGGGHGYDGGAGIAAIIAALGNRNEGSDNAALIAALGNRNDGAGMAGMLPALLAGGGGFGGQNALWPIILLALLGRGRGGLFGGDEGGCGGAGSGLAGEFLMSKLGTIEGSIPLAAANTANEICRSTGEISNQLNQNNIAQLTATAGVKDAVVNTGAILLQDNARNTQSVLSAICGLSSKMDQNMITDLERRLGVAEARAAEERNHGRVREVEVSVTQQVNQAQAQQQHQWQTQRQFDDLRASLFGIVNSFNQVAAQRQGQDVVNLGTMLGSATQSAANTAVR